MEYYTQYQLKSYNSLGTEAFAKLFCEPKNVSELKQCLHDYPDEKKLVIGGGCNLFFTKDFDGLIIHPQLTGLREFSDDDDDNDEVFLEVMASENWDSFVGHCVENGFSGLENLSLIPGTVGASPVQNIGAYGSEVKDCIREVVALDMQTGESVSFSNSECEFAYRESYFKKTSRYVILSVIFQLHRSFQYVPKYFDLNKELEELEEPSLEDVRNAVIRIRQRKLPDEKVLPNAGSFFKNPYITLKHADKLRKEFTDIPAFPYKDGLVKTSAAYLLDKLGYKGKRVGNVGSYQNQPLILVNYGNASGVEIVNFMNEIIADVKNKFDIQLEPEVRIY